MTNEKPNQAAEELKKIPKLIENLNKAFKEVKKKK
jgi:hypothetical protein